MKSYKHLFEKLVDPENIRKAILNASKRKKDRAEVLWVLSTIDTHVKAIEDILLNNKFEPQVHEMTTIHDKSSMKERRIIKPYFYKNQKGEPVYEQIIQHAVIQVLGPLIKKSSYEYSCGSMPGRGCHSGMKYLRTQIQRYKDTKELKYFFKGDFKHFYENIDTNILRELLAKKIHDKRFLNILYAIIDSNAAYYKKEYVKKGIPIGFYSSQWLANFFLQEMDHYIKEKFRVKIYVRYMDDFVLFHSNKKILHKIFEWIKEFAKSRNLLIKKNYRVALFDYYNHKQNKRVGCDVSFMGFRFFRDKVILRKALLFRALRAAKKVDESYKNKTLNWYIAARLLSYIGWFEITNTYNFYHKEILPIAHLDWCRQVVSEKFKRDFKKKEKRVLLLENKILYRYRFKKGEDLIVSEKDMKTLKRLEVLKKVLQIKTPKMHKNILRRINYATTN